MKVYTYTEARQRLASLLERAKKEGGVRFAGGTASSLCSKPEQPAGSPLDVKGIDLGVTTEEIVAFVRESRKIRPRG